MRPDRQELIERGILHAQTERERHVQREAVGARLTRWIPSKVVLNVELSFTHFFCFLRTFLDDWASARHRKDWKNVTFLNVRSPFCCFKRNQCFNWLISCKKYYLTGTSPAEEKKEREEKKMTLFRKLSFRPTVEELKARKVKKKSWNLCSVKCYLCIFSSP